MAELEDILMELFASNKLEAVKEAEAKLLSWRDNHTAKMVREARLDEQNQTDLHIGWQEIMFVPNGDWDKAITQKERVAQLTTNSKEEEQCQIG